MIYGITGSRHGTTEAQNDALRAVLNMANRDESVVHHGDCIGVDDQVHKMCEWYGIVTHIHPPSDPKARAFNTGDLASSAKPYLDRNRDIVDACEILLAVPRVGSRGTLYTIGYARKQGKPVWIFEDPQPVGGA